MTDEITRADLLDLLERAGPQLTILAPTFPPGPQAEQNPIRLKNLLKRAERSLDAAGVAAATVERILAPARALRDDAAFWAGASDGLALFAGEGWMRELRLPIALPEGVWVGERPHVLPLLPLLTAGDDGSRFHLLAISQKQIRLFSGDRRGLQPMKVALPTGIDEVLADFSFEKSVQMHGGPRIGQGRGVPAGTFHGHGAGKEQEKEHLVELFRRVDRAVRDHLGDGRVPLVLAGVDYLLPIYREASAHRGLLEEGITGNFDRAEEGELHRKAWALLEPRLERRSLRRDARRFRKDQGTGRAIDDPAEVIRASREGRIETLFADVGRPVLGRLDERTAEVDPRADPAEDLSNRAALDTLSHRGSVHAVTGGATMPTGSPLAAILRF